MMVPCDPPDLGCKLTDVFQSACFDQTDRFSIQQARPVAHTPYARVLAVNAAYAQQLSIRRTINGTDLGHMFGFGGDGDAGRVAVNWHKVTVPVGGRLNYAFSASSWNAGRHRGANGFNLAGSTHERGIHFRIGVDDAGRWAHGGLPDKDFKDYIVEFALLMPGQANWLIQIHQEGILVF